MHIQLCEEFIFFASTQAEAGLMVNTLPFGVLSSLNLSEGSLICSFADCKWIWMERWQVKAEPNGTVEEQVVVGEGRIVLNDMEESRGNTEGRRISQRKTRKES